VPALLSSLIDRVGGHAGVPQQSVRLGGTGLQVLVAALRQVPDPRDRRGVRHAAPVVLTLAIAAVLAGSRSFYAVGQWIAGASQETLKAAGARRDPGIGRWVGPDEKTVRNLCARIDADALDTALGGWVARRAGLARAAKARTGRKPPKGSTARRRAKAAGQRRARASARDAHRPPRAAIAVDGKTSRGAHAGGGQAPHLVAAVTHTGVVLGQRQVSQKSNEIIAFQPLLTDLPLADAVITADAMQTQRAHARVLRQVIPEGVGPCHS
jgi:hypothetical protein